MLSCRRMTEEDLLQVLEIERQNFSMPWSMQGFADWLRYDYTYLFVACRDELVAGYVGACRAADEFDISNIAVRSDFRRQGVGSMLLDNIISVAKDCGAAAVNLEVRESNSAAISLYERKNFQNMGVRRNFYEKPVENAIIYRYKIS